MGLLATVFIGERLLTITVTGVQTESPPLPVWLPEFGSIGETLVVYGLLLDS